MTASKNAARVAVQAEPCQKLAEVDCNAIFGVKWPEGNPPVNPVP